MRFIFGLSIIIYNLQQRQVNYTDTLKMSTIVSDGQKVEKY